MHKLVGVGGVLLSGTILTISGFDDPTASLADKYGGEVINKEPHKCLQWRWCDINDLPAPLFISLKNYLAQNTLPTEY